MRTRRSALVALLVLGLTVVATTPALAGKPDHFVELSTPVVFPTGDVCDFAVQFENTSERTKSTTFDLAPDGSQRTLIRGTYETLATNLDNGTTYTGRGGAVITIVTDADGSVRVDVRGSAFIAWYYQGDNSNLEPGLYDVNGHATEWYSADGMFVRAVVRGQVTDLCDTLLA